MYVHLSLDVKVVREGNSERSVCEESSFTIYFSHTENNPV